MAREGACTFTKMSYPVRRRFFFRFPCTLVADLTRTSTLQPDDVTQENFGDLGYTGLRVAEGVQVIPPVPSLFTLLRPYLAVSLRFLERSQELKEKKLTKRGGGGVPWVAWVRGCAPPLGSVAPT
eukprot:COSAG04_NODE_502_length_13354_cov_548.289777_3_plen_125_part_00